MFCIFLVFSAHIVVPNFSSVLKPDCLEDKEVAVADDYKWNAYSQNLLSKRIIVVY